MDGKQRRLSTVNKIGIALLMVTALTRAAEQPLDLEFLEWLGQMAEVEELGVDIEQLLLSKEQTSDEEASEANLNDE
jgi:hypothetical protein